MTTPPQTVLVTGASGGIGLELAKRFAAGGHNLVLVARKKETLDAAALELEETYRVHVTTIVADLSDSTAPDAIIRELDTKQITVDILVNNAGVGVYGDFSTTSLDQELRMMQVNMTALTALSKRLLPAMLAKKSGKILNVASTAAFEPGPGMAVYFATKAFVLSLSEALAEELRGTGVTVTCLCPGPTKTQFDVAAGATNSSLFTGRNVMSASDVADQAYRGLMRGRRLVVPGIMNRLLIYSLRLTPRAWVPRIVRMIMK